MTHTDLCTCHLEPAFFAVDPDTGCTDHWEVRDAECEFICSTDDGRYATLIAELLNRRASEKNNLCACTIHFHEEP